ncbi:hypothetical protein RF11_13188 [Thelohanellus kitauei]|uniref:Uncharacterized protein n=1 Tax=Thelohanellus kitauei TaxID=669202 RepID=A0A0C2MUC9_THEKT|nr:hypothetical protein RF11_13188 [Thelohanellus kitauei]
MTTLKLLTLDSVVKLCLFYKIGSHGANLNPFLEFIASKYPKISQSLECSILKSLGETGQSLTNNLQCIIDGFKASYPVIPKIDQIHFLILLQYLLDCHEEVGHYLAEIKFPIKTRLQCLFLAVKFVDHILQNTDTNSQLRNNPEFVLLNFLCLKKCSKILLNSGCYREANSFIFILAQQSYSLRSPLFHYFSLNLLMEYLEPNQTQRPAIQENINDLKPILEHLLNPKFDPTNAEFEPKFLGQLDLNPYYPYCKNTTTQDLFDIKWDTVRKYPDLFIDGFNEINCCNLIGYEKKELNYEINNNNALSTLLDKLVISQKKSHARKAEVDRLFYPSNSVSFKTSLRSFTFTNFSNLGQVEIASCIQLSICLAFYSYHSINLTKHFLEYFNPSSKNAVQEFCILDKPEIHLRDVTNYICDLSEKISKTWTIIHICYFKAQETTETNDYLIITIGVGSQAFAYRKCIKHDIDYETSLKRIVAENDTSSARVGAEYWNHRYLLEERLSNFIEELDNAWFGNMKHIIRGNCSDSPFNDSVNRLFEEFVKKFKKRISFHVFEVRLCQK